MEQTQKSLRNIGLKGLFVIVLIASVWMLSFSKIEAKSIWNESLAPSVQLDENEKIIQVSLGAYHTVVLTDKGRVFNWGYNFWGNLGINDASVFSTEIPRELTFPLVGSEKIIQISAGGNNSAALTDTGRVFTWGINYTGQLGIGTTNTSVPQQSVPGEVTNWPSKTGTIIQVCIGGSHSSALTDQGEVYTWGNNDRGQLGIGSTLNQSSPKKVTNFPGKMGKIVQVSLGDSHTGVLTDQNEVYL